MARTHTNIERIAEALEHNEQTAVGARIRELEDGVRSHLATLSSILFGFSLMGLQVQKPVHREELLFISWVAFGIAIIASMLHGLMLPPRLRGRANDQSNIRFKQNFNTLGFVLLVVGLVALGAFGVLNVPN